jgi:5-methylcytosine-specific restriction endonuclease McrA
MADCPKCGYAFVWKGSDNSLPRVYCSRACQKAVQAAKKLHGGRKNNGTAERRARRAGVYRERVSRLAVFERDGWKCQICGCKTPKKLLGDLKHPSAPQLDHRIPLKLGGDHTYANCQTSCAACNRDKGSTRIRGQVDLFPVHAPRAK